MIPLHHISGSFYHVLLDRVKGDFLFSGLLGPVFLFYPPKQQKTAPIRQDRGGFSLVSINKVPHRRNRHTPKDLSSFSGPDGFSGSSSQLSDRAIRR